MLSGEGPIFLQLAERVAENIINGTYAVLYKKRGIGMFVSPGARQQLLAERKAAFKEQHVAPLLHEASLLGITSDELADMIKEKDQS